jgi:hypothetical protein
MVNYPAFPFATAAEYVKFFEIHDAESVGEKIAEAASGVWEGTTPPPRHWLIIAKIRGQKVANPLGVRYWSGSPYWLSRNRRQQSGEVFGCACRFRGD